MSGLVKDLQEKAIYSDNDVSTLLRIAFLVAEKLDLEDSERWISKELNGYKRNDKIPSYRILDGKIGYQLSINGEWNLLDINKDIVDRNDLGKKYLRSSISHLENSVENSPQFVHFSFSDFDNSIIKQYDFDLLSGNSETIYSLRINTTAIKSILNEVRNKILKWALELEKAGILGSGMSFSNLEKENTKDFHWTINNVFNGGVSNSQIQQGTQDSSQSMTNNQLTFELDKITRVVDSFKSELHLSSEKHISLEEELEFLKREKEKDEPDRTKIFRAVDVIKQIATNAGGGVASSLILQALANLPI
ncbi:hypothetical protein [Marinococcus sp. PL1-022]|uniref:AbiTii domain-containing protein n=1 Tax=Marinococcus sp. PL1-022 TaxID=3095363 RepID=UPI0029C3845A|nr:hypothetical protein [Marinococcus sp. PL1-022]MDX6154462.1 hypothetical protein [Marinococcus sp. PL1-022]